MKHSCWAVCALAALLVACQRPKLDPVQSPEAVQAPGADGRAVLWIEPKAPHPLGTASTAHAEELKSLGDNAGDTPEAVAAIREQLDSLSPRVRSAAVDALQSATHPSAHPALLAAAADAHPAVRELAIDALSELSRNVADPLFEAALWGEDTAAAMGAAQHWRLLVADPDSSPTTARLGQALQKCPHPAARMALLPCDRADDRPIANALVGDPAGLAARSACALLKAEAGSVAAAPELVSALGDDHAAVRAAAARGLAAGAAALSEPARAAALAALHRASQTIDSTVAIPVAWAQASLGNAEGIASLAVYLRAGEGAVRIAALDALAALAPGTEQLKRPDLHPALARASSDDDVEVRRRVAWVTGRLDDARAVTILSRLVADRAPEVRAAAAWGFGRAGRIQEAGPYMIDIITVDSDTATVDAAYATLEHLVNGHPLPAPYAVKRFLDDTRDGARPFFGRDHVRWRRWFQTEGR